MAASVLLGGFAAVYFWWPKMFGRMMHEGLAKWHFWGTMIGLNIVFMGMMVVGYAGMHRRLYNPFVYDFMQKLIPLNTFITMGAFLMGVSQLLFLCNIFLTFRRGKPAGQNPWNVGTLEWTVPSPVPHYNFKTIPEVKCGPHELGNPALTQRDFQYQTEPLVRT